MADVKTPEERREAQRESERAAIMQIIDPIHETTNAGVHIELTADQSDTVFDAPGNPILWGLRVHEANPRPGQTEWTMQGQFNEVVCFLNGFQTALMLLAMMVGSNEVILSSN
jgi:hypothetical protein